MMTRKDYVTTASILSAYREQIPSDVFADLVDDFSSMFLNDNHRFDEKKFSEACGLVVA